MNPAFKLFAVQYKSSSEQSTAERNEPRVLLLPGDPSIDTNRAREYAQKILHSGDTITAVSECGSAWAREGDLHINRQTEKVA